MYYSIMLDNRYCVVLRDGVAEALIMELPTEVLADEVAFQLQMAGSMESLRERMR
ncbi:hypothetical protein NSS94_21500 [Paenibacillus sp. FSL L8-0644]|uniref:hypothetical protein n=1 Tax=Paenibacillus sp. FSL L8-0644 TaxID=2954523 RepID=UPI0030F7407D